MRILRAFAQVKGREGFPGLFQDFEDGCTVYTNLRLILLLLLLLTLCSKN